MATQASVLCAKAMITAQAGSPSSIGIGGNYQALHCIICDETLDQNHSCF